MTDPIQYFPPNTRGRDFYAGDIHGAFKLLDKALSAVNFDPARDRLFVTGDLINRGKHSERALDYLAQPWFHSIRGNHEQFLIDSFKNGYKTAKEKGNPEDPDYGWIFNQKASKAKKLVESFKQLPLAIVIDRGNTLDALVHATVPLGKKWASFARKLARGGKKTTKAALNGRDRIEAHDASGVPDIHRVFLGHTVQEDGMTALGNCYYIDTGAYLAERGSANNSLTLVEANCLSSELRGPHEKEAGGKVTIVRHNRYSI